MPTRVARRTESFTESVIREMTRLIAHYRPEDGINLAQGFPDFSAPQEIKDAACEAIQADVNQYAITWGAKPFRDAIARKAARWTGIDADPEREITVTCGATEGMIAAMLALLNPDDEVIVFEPFYENYGPDAKLSAAKPVFVRLNPPDWSFDRDALETAFNSRTRAIILNTPNNPTGKVFSQSELSFIADLCLKWDCLALTDEIYEYMVYDGLSHMSIASLPGMKERTVIVNGLSKTYSVTGWRVGYVIAPADLSNAIRKVHDFLTVGAAAPLQAAGVVALQLPDHYYEQLLRAYTERRDFLMDVLLKSGFRPFRPSGAYYIMCGIENFGCASDVEFANFLVREVGVAVVPGSSFFSEPRDGSQLVRFAFPKRMETLQAVGPRLHGISKAIA